MFDLMPSDKELIDKLVDQYTDLQRIIKSDDWKKEANYQLQVTKAKLESLGIHTTDLDMN